MGDRGQVQLVSEGNPDLYLYTHWTANSLPETVANALDRSRGRWSDHEYLNRIIFSEMIQHDVLGDIGYGIGFGLHGDVWRVVEINQDTETIGIKEINYEDYDLAKLDFTSGEKWIYTTEMMPYDFFIAEHATMPVSTK